ncbi:hypothetical protein TRFO_19352 [Tritrichomonas foetus]|uniref:RRM domain-containing protein n=1 Tax=Tritrichomonas foetus TaxID=1144522 RepID=A0A1J4KJI4_9EUKA|nr:hypothetical protein TRFO_19352 [Tritrichomonas foetus]|eukprot:OHT11258.1 hypothetical protein TRFO_19352 [Tritrichomonas foetus]
METGEEIFPWEGRILVAANLPYDVTPAQLRDYFAPRGKILRVDIERNKQGDSNGLGFVEFLAPADCAAAAELHGTQFEGRTLKCKVSTRPPPELLRFYIRPPDNRPLNDRVRKNIIDEWRNGGPTERKPRSERVVKKPRHFPRYKRNQNNKNENSETPKGGNDQYSDYSDSYGYYSDSGSYSYSD